MPFVIHTGDCKLVELVAVADPQALSHVSERENDFLTGNLCFAKHRPRLRQLAPIYVGQRPEGHALTDLEFIFRMDVMGFTDIDGHDQSCVWSRKRRAALRLTQVAPRLVRRLRFWISVVGQLNNTEWEVAFAPTFAPGSDHRWQEDAVLLRPRFIRFALIPDRAANK